MNLALQRKIGTNCASVWVFAVFASILVSAVCLGQSDSASPLLISVREGTKWGAIDKTARLRIPFQFDSGFWFSEGLADVTRSGKCGYIDETGRLRIPYQRCYIFEPFHEGFAVVSRKRRGKRWYIDKDGRVLKGARFAFANAFSEGLASVKPDSEGLWGYIDTSGRFAITPKFEDFPGDFSEGVASVRLGGKIGFIDKTGGFVIAPKFEHAEEFREGLAPVELGGKWGFIDHSGNWVIEPRFDYARRFSDGLAAVMVGAKGGYVDRRGTLVVAPKYGQVYPFSDGYAEVVNGTVGYIDTKGNEVLPVIFSEASYQGEGLWMVFIHGEIRIIDAKQNVIYKYDARDPNCVRQNPRFPKESEVFVSLTPAAASVQAGGTVQFQSVATGFASPFLGWSVDSAPEDRFAGCSSPGDGTPDFVRCPSGEVGNLRQTGRNRKIRTTATYFAPPVPGRYYVSFEAWQTEGCNGDGSLKKRAVAEVTVTP